MIQSLALFAFALLQQPSAPPPEPRHVEPWTGGLAAGLREMQRLCDEKKTDDALLIGERLLSPTRFARWREEHLAEGGWRAKLVGWSEPVLAGFGVETVAPADRALVQYSRGVVLAQSDKKAEKRAESEAAFARALGEGERSVQLDALYNVGVSAFGEGEEWRAKLPEKGAPPAQAPAMQAVPGGNGPNAPPPPDPLAQARAAYLRARESLVQRLRTDWQDGDTRAMSELVQRRLKELDEIEKQRKKQEQDDKQKQKDQKDQKDKKDDGQAQDKDKDKQDDKDKQPPKDQDKNQDKQGDKDQQDKQDKQDPAKDQKDQKKPDEKPPEPKPGDKDKQDAQDDKKDTAQAQGEERELSQEEVTRLFDKLKQLEEQARKLREQFRRSHRQAVKKDW
jgi:hypothetical protein